jgi:hypothetical protein
MVLRRSQSTIVLIGAATGVVVLFYTKSYFVFILPAIILFLYTIKGLKPLLIFMTACAVLFLIAMSLVKFFYPSYFYASILAQAGAVGGLWGWALTQTKTFSANYWPLFLGLLLYVIQVIPSNKLHYRIDSILSKLSFRNNINSNEFIYLYSLAFGLLCLVPLSRNTGAYLNYHYQLLIPALTIIGLTALARLKIKLIQNFYLILLIVLCIFHGQVNNHSSIYSVAEVKNWERVNAILGQYRDNQMLIASPIVAPLQNHNTLVLDNGHSECYIGLMPDPSKPSLLFQLFPDHQIYFKSFVAYYSDIHQKIKQQGYNLIVVTKEYHPMVPQDLLNEKYNKLVEITLQTGGQKWHTEFWTPKH